MTVEVLEVAQQEGLGEEFRAAVKVQVAKIRAHPGAWMLIRPGVRKCLGRKIPLRRHLPGYDGQNSYLGPGPQAPKAIILGGSRWRMMPPGCRGREDDHAAHSPSCCRISVSARRRVVPASGFCRQAVTRSSMRRVSSGEGGAMASISSTFKRTVSRSSGVSRGSWSRISVALMLD